VRAAVTSFLAAFVLFGRQSHEIQVNTQRHSVLCFFVLTVTVTVTEALVLRPPLEDRGRITESIRILVLVDRMKQKCFHITTKRVRRSQQCQLRRAPVPCSRCSNLSISLKLGNCTCREEKGRGDCLPSSSMLTFCPQA